MNKIILLGYMGCGKTTIGQKLAVSLNRQFIDLDQYIEQNEKLSIKKLFESNKEIQFRKLEHHYLKELISNPDSFVLSLGGGTPCYANNHLMLQADHITSVYLKASIATLTKRLEDQKDSRPLLANQPDDELAEFIAKHIFERSYFYSHATHTVNIDGKSIETIVQEITDLNR
ncbi:MAG: shikimate kinase [Flavobacterium sp.]